MHNYDHWNDLSLAYRQAARLLFGLGGFDNAARAFVLVQELVQEAKLELSRLIYDVEHDRGRPEEDDGL